MASVAEYKCPNCGGQVQFDSASQQLLCLSCGAHFAVSQFEGEADRREEAMRTAAGGGEWGPGETDGLREYVCPSCGGHIVTDQTTAAGHCPYCDSPTVMPAQLSGIYRPDRVIPFRLDKSHAQEAYRKETKSKPLLPKLFTSQAVIESLTSVYVPFWLFDTRIQGDLAFDATRVSTWSDSDNIYTKTDRYEVRRAGTMDFSLIPADASAAMDDTYMEAIEPFDYRLAEPFEVGYLLGYVANNYDVAAEQSAPRALARAEQTTRTAFADSVRGFDSVSAGTGPLGPTATQVHYILAPVWTLNVRYADKLYSFAMNGQTGKFVGRWPIDKGKQWGYFGAIFGGLAVVVSLVIALAMGVIG